MSDPSATEEKDCDFLMFLYVSAGYNYVYMTYIDGIVYM
jgi:hypothetical protein